MSATLWDDTIEQGATFRRVVPITLSSGNLSDYAWRMELRVSPGAPVLAALTSAADGGLTVSDADKTITVEIDATDTAALTLRAVRHDMFGTDANGVVIRATVGTFTITPRITQPAGV